MPRDSGESIFAARHQDVSQGPLGGGVGSRRGWIWRFWGAPIFSPEVPKCFCKGLETSGGLVAQCSATPTTVAATPPCSVSHLFRPPNFGATPPGTGGGGGGAIPKFLGGVARHRCYTCKTL